MVDHDLVLAKAGLIRRHLRRIEEKGEGDLEAFFKDTKDINDFIISIFKKLGISP